MHYHRGGYNPSPNTIAQDWSSMERSDEQIDYRLEAGIKPDIARLRIEAKSLEGSGGKFRDAQVFFEESQVSVYVVDRGGKSWKFRSKPLPGPIVVEECCFQVDKTGEEVCITLKKANLTEHWEKDDIIFSHNVAQVDVVECVHIHGDTPPSQRQLHQGYSSTRPGLKLQCAKSGQTLGRRELSEQAFSPCSPTSVVSASWRDVGAYDGKQLGQMFT